MKITRMLGCLALCGATLFAGAAVPRQAAGVVQVIEVSAKKYEFGPSEIRVKKGAHVQIHLHATDKAHGLKIKSYPDGEKDAGPVGLRFVGDASVKVEKDATGTLEFIAERAGTYSFECAKFCGFGHGGMKGKLIVEE